MSTSERIYWISHPDQLALLHSGLRQEIVDVVCVSGPCSIAELGAYLGRAPNTLYYHVRMLVEAGLLLEAGTRGEGRSEEQTYATPSRHMQLDTRERDPEKDAHFVKIAAGAMRAAARDLKATLERGEPLGKGQGKHTGYTRTKGWLTKDDVARVNRLLDEITSIYLHGERRPGARLASFTSCRSRLDASDE